MDLLNSNVPSTLAVAVLILLVFEPVPLLMVWCFLDDNSSPNKVAAGERIQRLELIVKFFHRFGSANRSGNLSN